MSAVIRWEDPPPAAVSRRRTLDHAAIAAELRGRPGQWALVFAGRYVGFTSNIVSGVLAAYRPAGDFEAVSRVQSDGRGGVYARYVGGPS